MVKNGFFEYGEIGLEASDKVSRQIALRICMPFGLMQTATPVLLGAGLIDENEIRNPIAVWVPKITENVLNPLVVERITDIIAIIERALQETVRSSMTSFQDLGKAFQDPAFLISMLPIGTYVRFRFRGDITKFAAALDELEKYNIVGIPEFRYACAQVLAEVLISFDQVA